MCVNGQESEYSFSVNAYESEYSKTDESGNIYESKLVKLLATYPCDQSHVSTRIWRGFAAFLCKDFSHSSSYEDSCVRILRMPNVRFLWIFRILWLF